jgi:AraC family transcriptional regulator
LSDATELTIAATPPAIFARQRAQWTGLEAERVEHTRNAPYEFRFAPSPTHHMLLLTEQVRSDGETFLEGLPRSTLRNSRGRLTWIPSGHGFSGWSTPRVLGRAFALYIDPHGPLIDPRLRLAEMELMPRLFFEDAGLRQTVDKLKALVASHDAGSRMYAEALSAVLIHELVRLQAGTGPAAMAEGARVRGGLTRQQQRRVAEYIDEHLAQDISLATLAGLAELSPFHFLRSFRQSFGMPPHRYHIGRRIERAKTLLADPRRPIAVVAAAVGFHSSSAFTAAFQRSTRQTPSGFRRALD